MNLHTVDPINQPQHSNILQQNREMSTLAHQGAGIVEKRKQSRMMNKRAKHGSALEANYATDTFLHYLLPSNKNSSVAKHSDLSRNNGVAGVPSPNFIAAHNHFNTIVTA